MTSGADEFALLLKTAEDSGRRVVIFDECASTQDIAREAGPNAIALARRQTAGRGRLGRAWADTAGAGLAMSLTLDTKSAPDPGVLSIGVGLAACQACERVLRDPHTTVHSRSSDARTSRVVRSDHASPTTSLRDAGPEAWRRSGSNQSDREVPAHAIALGLRWPNDVVERNRGRKLAGVLIERSADLFVVGVGINVLQRESEWPDALRGRAVSLLELNPQLDPSSFHPLAEAPSLDAEPEPWRRSGSLRALVALELLRSIDRVLTMPSDQIARDWSARDTLVGTKRTFEHAGNRIFGAVVSVDPLSHLIVRDDAGTLHRLPALTTSMVHGATP